MKNEFFGLKAPYEFLFGAKKRLEDPDNLPNVAWTAEEAPYEKNPQHSNGRKGKKPGKKSAEAEESASANAGPDEPEQAG